MIPLFVPSPQHRASLGHGRRYMFEPSVISPDLGFLRRESVSSLNVFLKVLSFVSVLRDGGWGVAGCRESQAE